MFALKKIHIVYNVIKSFLLLRKCYNGIEKVKWGEFYMKLKLTAAALLLSAMLAGCGSETTNEGTSKKENETQNMKELVHDYSAGNISDVSASITSHQLMVKNSEGNEQVYDLSKEEFFVSIAPYVNETHP
jgi:hypothetical protein